MSKTSSVYRNLKRVKMDVSLLQIYLNTEKEYFDPLSIPYKLLRRWMGEDIELDAVENRLACLQIRCCLLPIRGLWKDIQNTYRIVKSDEKVEQFVKSVGEINIDDIMHRRYGFARHNSAADRRLQRNFAG